MKRLLCCLIPLLLVLLWAIPDATADSAREPATPLQLTAAERAWLQQHPVVRVRVSDHYPPFEFFADGHYQGLAWDYLQAVACRLGIEFRPVAGMTWPESLDAIRARRGVDLILLVSRTPERGNFLEFTRDYLAFDLVIFAPRQGPAIANLEDLAGRVVAVERGYLVGDWLRRDLPGVQLLEQDSSEAALLAVAEGRAAAYVGDLAVGSYLIDQKGLANLKVAAPTPYGADALAMGVRKDWPELASLLDRALGSISEAERRELRQKWLSVRYDTGIELGEVLLWTLGIGALALAWILHLRLLVKRRTASLEQEVALRREHEQALERNMDVIRDANQRLSFQIQRMPLAYIVWDTDFRVVEWNPAAQKIFGWSLDEARGRHPYELIVPAETQPLVEAVWQRLLAGEEESFSENLNVTKDGGTLVCNWYNTPFRDARGTIAGVLSMVQDVTEQRRRQDLLQDQFQQFSAIFDAINAVVFVADLDSHQLLYLNHQGIQLAGENWRDKPCFQVLQADRETPFEPCGRGHLLQEGEPAPPCSWEFCHPQNGRWYQCIDRAIRWPDGRLVHMEMAFENTETRQLEQLKDEMISAVSHEMHTPLIAILGYTEFMLENKIDDPQRQEYLATVHDQTHRLNRLIDSFLNLQRLRARQQVLRFRSLPVADLLRDSMQRFAEASPRHRFRLEVPPESPAVRGDSLQLQQMLDHLLANAVKYSPAGGEIVIGAGSEGRLVKIWVQDNGVGIPVEALERVFDRFYRVDNTDRRIFGGAGLGLALVREIVNAHGGRVWAESTEHVGTTITLVLPAATAEDRPEVL